MFSYEIQIQSCVSKYTVYVNKISPYSNSNYMYFSSTVSTVSN